jgi:hypothetical protein
MGTQNNLDDVEKKVKLLSYYFYILLVITVILLLCILKSESVNHSLVKQNIILKEKLDSCSTSRTDTINY